MLAAVCFAAAAFSPAPLLSQRSVVGRTQGVSMQTKITTAFDRDGIFSGRASGTQKESVRILERVEELKILSAVADAGLLSAAEDAQLFSKLESAGAFSQAEKLLPLADDLNLLATAEGLLNVPSSNLVLLAGALVVGEVGLISAVPDDNTALVALQLLTGVAAGAGAVVLLASASLFSLLQATD